MSWLSSAWHSLTGTPDGSVALAQQGQIQQQQQATQAANAQAAADAAKALKAQQDANLIAAAVAVPQLDSESARASGDNQLRKLQQGSAFGIGLPDKFGAPPVGFRLLSGQ